MNEAEAARQRLMKLVGALARATAREDFERGNRELKDASAARMKEILDQELFDLILAADQEAFREGSEPPQRSMFVISKVMKRLGYQGFFFAAGHSDPLTDRIAKMHRSLYRTSDVAIGGMHGGIFMFRDIFARIYVPFGYGIVGIKPFKLTDLSDMQLRWLSSQPDHVEAFLDQFIQVFDFGGGLGGYADYRSPTKEAVSVFRLAAYQLQAAAATLSAAFVTGGAVQSALIGTELAIKAGLAQAGASETDRKRHGHDLAKAASTFAQFFPRFDLKKVLSAINEMPEYVENRYSTNQPGRLETGHIVMNAQYIAGEVMRQVTGYSIRNALTNG